MNDNLLPINSYTFSDPERLFYEINLLRIEGYYFNFNPKSLSKNTDNISFLERIKTPEGFIEKPIDIDINSKYGRPASLAYKVLDAIIKKYSNYYYPFPEGVPFTYRELAKLTGRKSFGGKDQKEIFNAIMQLWRTGIWCSFYKKDDKQWGTVGFTIFDTVLLSGKKSEIKRCFLGLHPIIIQSLNNRHSFCLNYSRMEILEPIGSALFKHLFFHFSNLYSRKKNKNFDFTKDYKTICETWLGGLKPEKYKSKILSNQLGKHLKKLKQTGLIKKFVIEKNVGKDGFNLTLYPGGGFFEDYEYFYKGQLKFDFQKAVDQNTIQKPMELVEYFYRNLLKVNDLGEQVFEQTDVDLAKSLLEKYTFDDIKIWIDYSITQAAKTGFEMKRFGGIKIYRTEFFAKQKEIKARIDQRERERKHSERIEVEQKLKNKYEAFLIKEIERIKNALSNEELEKIKNTAQGKAIKKYGSHSIGIQTMIRIETDNHLVELNNVLSFEKWVEVENKKFVFSKKA